MHDSFPSFFRVGKPVVYKKWLYAIGTAALAHTKSNQEIKTTKIFYLLLTITGPFVSELLHLINNKNMLALSVNFMWKKKIKGVEYLFKIKQTIKFSLHLVLRLQKTDKFSDGSLSVNWQTKNAVK